MPALTEKTDTEQKFTPKPKIPGAVLDNTSKFSNSIWSYIYRKVGKEGEIKRKEIAEEVGTSTVTVWKVLKGFERCKLIEIKSFNGPGQGIHIKNNWLIKREEFKQKFIWKLGFQIENEYLKNLDINSNSLGVKQLEYISSSSLKHTLKEQPTGYLSKEFQSKEKKQRPKTFNEREAILSEVSNDVKIFKHSRYYRYMMERIRHLVWDLTDFTLEENQVFCNAIGKTIDGWDLGSVRDLIQILKEKLGKLVHELQGYSIFSQVEQWYRIAITRVWKWFTKKANQSSNRLREKTKSREANTAGYQDIPTWRGYGVELDYDHRKVKTKRNVNGGKSSVPRLSPTSKKPNAVESQGDGCPENVGAINRQEYFEKLIERHGKKAVLPFLP